MQKKVLGEVCAAGGSLSRLPVEVYREAADLAYHFHWQRKDIMEMTMKERRIWLAEISRIHKEQKRAREEEMIEQFEQIENYKNRETGRG